MDGVRPLNDVFELALSDLNLIEASAGTGKTYTIASLYLRLVLEAERPVNRILVVTYTKAATAELRDRIRKRLVEAREAFQTGAAESDFCRRLLARHAGAEPTRQALRRLANAIRGFDEAAIYTIHGFCQRVLADDAFESGMPFDSEMLSDQREILQEIVDDFWRRTFYDASPLLVNYLLDAGYTPEKLLSLVRAHVGKPYLKVLGARPAPALAAAEAAFGAAYAQVRALWPSAREPVEALLRDSAALNANKYRKASIPVWCALMDEYLLPQTPNLKLFERFEKFTARCLAESVKKGQAAPEHVFFHACNALAAAYEELAACYEWHLRALRVDLLHFCNAELGRRKRQRQVQFYDDLLNNLDRALAGRRGEALAEHVRQRYSAALIDEFQDTDPVQYSIFRRLYAATDLPVFLVGDPKQAIYSFRGADIFAYLEAREDAFRHYTLDVNWRSDPKLIEALNAIFGANRRPFLFKEIPFQPARAAGQPREPFLIEGDAEPPFRFWFLGWDEDQQPVTKGEAAQLAARATAVEIARLLNLGATAEAHVDGRPLDGGDVAVLVRNHRQGRLVREALLALGVPSVQQAQDNVLHSWEALELERVLMAVAEPGHEPLVRAALATDMLGETGNALYRLGEDEQAWEVRLNAFHEYHRLWREHGFVRMFRTLCSEEDVARRLLGFRDGERRLTNLLHLEELLQSTASRQRSGMDGLIKWLSERRRSEATDDEEHQLRLESDEHLVKIVTVHKSKGMEYPIVFCPFLWDGRLWADDAETFTFHDPQAHYRPVVDLGSEEQDEWRQQACREELAENLRLLYVALTRARYHCYMVWGTIRGSGSAAPAWLFHAPPGAAPLLNAIKDFVENLSEGHVLAELTDVAKKAEGAIRIESLPEEDQPYQPPAEEPPPLVVRHFPGPIRGQWRIASFTGLVASRQLAELPDYDALVAHGEPEPAAAAPGRTRFGFPRGARAGSCLHAIFEHWDFTRRNRTELERLVETTLEAHGFEAGWTDVVADWVERVLAAPLDDKGLRLETVSPERRLNELEFYYPLANLEPEGLRRLLAAQAWPVETFREDIEQLGFSPARGYMKGFIDLVFEAEGRYYLVDYKSNWLGATAADYGPIRLAEVMAREAYYLQYLIYALALHRYLSLRLPGYAYERHFGGVFYLFLRGMDPADPGKGVYRHRPARALIEALDEYLKSGSLD